MMMKKKHRVGSLPTLLIYLAWWVGRSNGFVVSRRGWLGRVESLVFGDGDSSHSFAHAAESSESNDEKRRLPKVIIFGTYAVYLAPFAVEQ